MPIGEDRWCHLHRPGDLANAGLLKGRTAVYPDGAAILKTGANYTGGTVEVDGRIITGNGPEAAQFRRKLASSSRSQTHAPDRACAYSLEVTALSVLPDPPWYLHQETQ